MCKGDSGDKATQRDQNTKSHITDDLTHRHSQAEDACTCTSVDDRVVSTKQFAVTVSSWTVFHMHHFTAPFLNAPWISMEFNS